jgi:hypothetical protein
MPLRDGARIPFFSSPSAAATKPSRAESLSSSSPFSILPSVGLTWNGDVGADERRRIRGRGDASPASAVRSLLLTERKSARGVTASSTPSLVLDERESAGRGATVSPRLGKRLAERVERLMIWLTGFFS